MIWFFRLSVLAYFATIVAAALLYPDRVPVHFDASGTADRFQSRGVAVLSMTGVGLVLGGLLGGCILFFRRGSLHHVNVPHRSWWMQPENQDRLRAMLAQDLAWVGGCTMTLLTVVLAITIRVADDPQPSMGAFGVAAILAFLVAVAGQVVLMSTWRYRPPRR
ncbi:DUF1648 domain-containing protein [Nocardioides jensenii]|uniref:DUF1648 domain-containing protein n=1 Tax=Nocardioides jensenii TaxID=1843 RepID=UPI0008323B31|nr:DUF1648 domain-containing protein [Nocardioides jensenii]